MAGIDSVRPTAAAHAATGLGSCCDACARGVLAPFSCCCCCCAREGAGGACGGGGGVGGTQSLATSAAASSPGCFEVKALTDVEAIDALEAAAAW